MDFIGFGPIKNNETSLPELGSGLVRNYFYEQDGLTPFLPSNSEQTKINGYIIEVKSRTTKNHWKPFTYSFSINQEKMFSKSVKYKFKVVLCGVSFAEDWELSVVLTNPQGKILPEDYFNSDQ